MSADSSTSGDASIGELMTQLSAQTSRLVKDELKLAQKEMQETAKHAGLGVGLFSAAGLLGLYGFGCVIATGIAALSLALPLWASALIVGVLLFAGAAVAALIGKGQVKQASPTPEQTVENVKKDIHEVKDARHDHA